MVSYEEARALLHDDLRDFFGTIRCPKCRSPRLGWFQDEEEGELTADCEDCSWKTIQPFDEVQRL